MGGRSKEEVKERVVNGEKQEERTGESNMQILLKESL
ncbi:MAG: hypothetical protein CM1200mP33_1400 [Chloroflexota bacterium]|nr:MAG: hypothetical protein CM1200mP33_1400 [Chloroflexota bacterium]